MRAPRAEEEAGFDCVIELVVACRQVSSGRAPAESAVRRRSRGDEKTPYRRMHLARAAQGVDVRVARGPRKAQESTWISRDGAAHGGKPAHGAARQRRRRTFRFQLRWRTLHQVQGCCGPDLGPLTAPPKIKIKIFDSHKQKNLKIAFCSSPGLGYRVTLFSVVDIALGLPRARLRAARSSPQN